ncbi:MAG TPA: hypothetical protein VHO48_00595, partial [Anaerolineaceae bacterium]|nr:hypothetical protein [Anaerolineaceae bacterium]
QSFPDAYPLGNHPCQNGAITVNSLGYPGQPDAIYHIKVNLPHNTAGLDFQLSAENLQPGSQWGVDNLSLTLKDLVDTQTFLPLIGR